MPMPSRRCRASARSLPPAAIWETSRDTGRARRTTSARSTSSTTRRSTPAFVCADRSPGAIVPTSRVSSLAARPRPSPEGAGGGGKNRRTGRVYGLRAYAHELRAPGDGLPQARSPQARKTSLADVVTAVGAAVVAQIVVAILIRIVSFAGVRVAILAWRTRVHLLRIRRL